MIMMLAKAICQQSTSKGKCLLMLHNFRGLLVSNAIAGVVVTGVCSECDSTNEIKTCAMLLKAKCQEWFLLFA